jgi:hypothetical protein
MFRSSTIIREPELNLAKVIFMLQHLMKLSRYLLCGCVAACHGMACVACNIHFYGFPLTLLTCHRRITIKDTVITKVCCNCKFMLKIGTNRENKRFEMKE